MTEPPLPGVPHGADLTGPLEALLLMATEPMPTTELAQAVRAPVAVVEETLDELVRFYDDTGRGFELRNVGGGWRYWTRAEHAELIGAWLVEGQHARLSQAALETLAVVAYLQPISRGRVSAVRGVNVDGVLRTLVTRDLVQEVDRDSETGAMLFGTTGGFLERLGLESLNDLPPIAPLLPDAAALESELRASSAVVTEEPLVELGETSDDLVSTGSTGGGPDASSVELVETPGERAPTRSTGGDPEGLVSTSSTSEISTDNARNEESTR
ncbi:MAG: SMC-Scp complex subunit ScpB [Micropruina sp.]